MKQSDIKPSELAIELALRFKRGRTIRPHALQAEFGFSRATAYRWLKRLRDVQDKLAPQQGTRTQRNVA